MNSDRFSVVIATYARPALVVRAVQSVLRGEHEDLELIVVDQSADDHTQEALEAISDPRLRVERLDQRGASAARNHGIRLARGRWVAFTDDDCEVRPDWLCALRRAFRSRPAPGLVLGRVEAAPFDREAGFIPACERPRRCVSVGLRSKPQIEVMAACLAAERQCLLELGGFDERIGPGTRWPAGEDYDLVLRALLASITVLETAEPSVVHHGLRTGRQAHELVRSYARGTARALGLRLGSRPDLLTVALAAHARAFLRSESSIPRTSPTRRWIRILPFLTGLAGGIATRSPAGLPALRPEPARTPGSQRSNGCDGLVVADRRGRLYPHGAWSEGNSMPKRSDVGSS